MEVPARFIWIKIIQRNQYKEDSLDIKNNCGFDSVVVFLMKKYDNRNEFD